MLGNHAGKGDVMMALKAFKEASIVSAVLFGLLAFFVFSYFRQIVSILTNDKDIAGLSYKMREFLILNIPLDCFAVMIRGVIKALGL